MVAAAAMVVADEERAFSCARSWGKTYPSHSDTTFQILGKPASSVPSSSCSAEQIDCEQSRIRYCVWLRASGVVSRTCEWESWDVAARCSLSSVGWVLSTVCSSPRQVKSNEFKGYRTASRGHGCRSVVRGMYDVGGREVRSGRWEAGR